jgi:tetratricopeptide (TPR) repeat protein
MTNVFLNSLLLPDHQMERLGRVDMLLELLENDPQDLFLNYALGLEYAGVLKFNEAQQQFKTVLGLDVNYIPCYYQLGKLCEAQSQILEALSYYKQGLEKARQKKDKSVHEFEEAIFLLED